MRKANQGPGAGPERRRGRQERWLVRRWRVRSGVASTLEGTSTRPGPRLSDLSECNSPRSRTASVTSATPGSSRGPRAHRPRSPHSLGPSAASLIKGSRSVSMSPARSVTNLKLIVRTECTPAAAVGVSSTIPAMYAIGANGQFSFRRRGFGTTPGGGSFTVEHAMVGAFDASGISATGTLSAPLTYDAPDRTHYDCGVRRLHLEHPTGVDALTGTSPCAPRTLGALPWSELCCQDRSHLRKRGGEMPGSNAP
jgi:hypothetical protein